MPKKKDSLICDNPSFLGRYLFKVDKATHNLRFYIRRHIVSIEIIFLLIYTILNLLLARYVDNPLVGIFIIVFLFVLGVERIIIHLKSRLDKEILDKKEIQIKAEVEDHYD